MKCMRKERKKRFRAHTNELKTKKYRGVWDRMKPNDPWVYIDSDISTDRDDIEKVLRTKSR